MSVLRKLFFPKDQKAFSRWGDVGRHPQFRHLKTPPKDYQILDGQVSWFDALKLFGPACVQIVKNWIELWQWAGVSQVSSWQVVQFIWWRGFRRIVPHPVGCEASFLPTFMWTQNNEHWFLEIEDITTLFAPQAWNGRTAKTQLRALPVFPLIRYWLESPKCLGVFTHVEETAKALREVFQSPILNEKTFHRVVPYVPLSSIREDEVDQLRESSEPIQFFFNNSWHQYPTNFYLRGGQSILEVFERAVERGAPVRLILRSRLPRKIKRRFAKLLASPQVEVLDDFLPESDYVNLLRSSHYFLLPSARLHVVSLMEAMYYGAVPIISDGWGMREYAQDRKNAFFLSGVYGRVSWSDEKTFELHEDYKPMFTEPGLLTESLDGLLKDLMQFKGRKEMALDAHRTIVAKHGVEAFNKDFSAFLTRMLHRVRM